MSERRVIEANSGLDAMHPLGRVVRAPHYWVEKRGEASWVRDPTAHSKNSHAREETKFRSETDMPEVGGAGVREQRNTTVKWEVQTEFGSVFFTTVCMCESHHKPFWFTGLASRTMCLGINDFSLLQGDTTTAICAFWYLSRHPTQLALAIGWFRLLQVHFVSKFEFRRIS